MKIIPFPIVLQFERCTDPCLLTLSFHVLRIGGRVQDGEKSLGFSATEAALVVERR
jgi:hypothetical protein